jgi:hypothetical protein
MACARSPQNGQFRIGYVLGGAFRCWHRTLALLFSGDQRLRLDVSQDVELLRRGLHVGKALFFR